MIHLDRDTLTFNSPNATSKAIALVQKEADFRLTRLLSETEASRIAGLKKTEIYQRANQTDRETAEQFISDLTQEQIQEAFHNRVSTILKGLTCSTSIGFQRTLRIPDDGRKYPLPAGFGKFPLREIERYREGAPRDWLERGGVLMPMYQSEALWIHFWRGSWPAAIQIGAGKINAISGRPWSKLDSDPQNYLVNSKQPWLDGFAVEKGVIRQFVAMPLGEGYSTEEQLTGKATWGGLQIQVYPLKPEEHFERNLKNSIPSSLEALGFYSKHLASGLEFFLRDNFRSYFCAGMGLAPGGRMKQEIYADPYGIDCWDTTESRRCFVHICNALEWRAITKENPPHPPLTAAEYEKYKIPWFDYYRDDVKALEGSPELATLQSVGEIHQSTGGVDLPGEGPIEVSAPISLGPELRPIEVSEGGETW